MSSREDIAEDDRQRECVTGGRCPTCGGKLDTGGDFDDLICIECGDEFWDENSDAN